MTITLYAQPYDITTTGFYFDAIEAFHARAGALRNDHGERVEEFELQVIDGDPIDAALARAIELSQVNLEAFLEGVASWDEQGKRSIIIAVGECGERFDAGAEPGDFEVDLYEVDSLRELAIQFVEEGLFGAIPEHLAAYIDHDAIARDLAMDYAETTIAGRRLVYRCG